ncbi:MAG: phosphoribosylanthranilate isomerase [Erythrobacter sp.]|jgi:phosphoribosylanthranilate isomerase|uniref:phosphoribosylanthranilate isomerase n=1 Tax=Qipengyuania citrea TaxID=225971 RepID=UPI0020A01EB8|nr:phosphoribosylanthranilate isomerase [Qipengyuania citrea]MCP2016229.1 phosphoribosylanthranilate isomerase [Qipengyuania citrea]MDE0900297.1 phosphoribosylanthranilate isomerase [Erythrobacter sp.]
MSVQIKICGLSTPETVDAAIEAGATHIGLVHYEPSPRHVALDQARELRDRVRGKAKAVLLLVNADPELTGRALNAIQPDIIQFHGSETPKWIGGIRRSLSYEVWKAVGLKDAGTLTRSEKYIGMVDRLLFDAPAKKLPGGNGTAFDWSLLAGHDHKIDWALAGGLTADNVAEAIRATQAPLVDTSSGVESAPGVKDPQRIADFCRAVRSA